MELFDAWLTARRDGRADCIHTSRQVALVVLVTSLSVTNTEVLVAKQGDQKYSRCTPTTVPTFNHRDLIPTAEADYEEHCYVY